MSSYYSSVSVKHSTEQPISIGRKLDDWGTKLIRTSQKAYGGKSYTVSHAEIFEQEGVGKVAKLNVKDRVTAALGVALKRLAAFFSKEVRTKYRLVGAKNSGERENLQKSLFETRKVTPKKEGDEEDFCLGFCLGLALVPTERHHHHHHHGWHHLHHHRHSGWHHHHRRCRDVIVIR